jgi:hypothetical protein
LPSLVLPAQTAQELVKALADLLLATVLDADHDEAQHDTCEDDR